VDLVLQLEHAVLKLLPLLLVSGFLVVDGDDESLADAVQGGIVNVSVCCPRAFSVDPGEIGAVVALF
jgi:hypothetical protein